MSKERLEEIDVRLKYGLGCLKNLRRKILNSDDESLKDQIRLLENDIKFLFEQAKRVQELEEIAEPSVSAFHTLEKLFIESEQQNKRYREALEEIMKIQENHEWNLYGIAYGIAEITLFEVEGE